jgi:hypothetical protein
MKRLETDLAKAKQRLTEEETARAAADAEQKKKEADIVKLQEEIILLKKRNETLARKMSLFIDMVRSLSGCVCVCVCVRVRVTSFNERRVCRLRLCPV